MPCPCYFAVSSGEFGLDVEDYLTGLSLAYCVLSYLLCELDVIYVSIYFMYLHVILVKYFAQEQFTGSILTHLLIERGLLSGTDRLFVILCVCLVRLTSGPWTLAYKTKKHLICGFGFGCWLIPSCNHIQSKTKSEKHIFRCFLLGL